MIQAISPACADTDRLLCASFWNLLLVAYGGNCVAATPQFVIGVPLVESNFLFG